MISIVVPCYNEEENVEDVYHNVSSVLRSYKNNYEIIFVDDGSTDSTNPKLEKIKKHDHRVVIKTHKKNTGLGKALETGFRSSSGDVIITTDADSTHNTLLMPKMIKLIETGYDVVIGSRYVKGGRMVNVPLYRVLVSMLAGFTFHLILGLWNVRDMTSGYRAYSKKAKQIHVKSSGFQSELEILYKISKMGARITEIPIVLEMRKKGNSKFRLIKIAADYLKLVFSLKLHPSK